MSLKRLSRSDVQIRVLEGAWPCDDVTAATVPDLAAFLSLSSWPDNSPRELGTLTISVYEGMLRARLCDKDAGIVAFVCARTLLELFQAADRCVGGEGGDWRVDKFASPPRKAKRS